MLLCAGGHSSSRTPKVPPGDCFFSNGFLIKPGMPFLQVPRSLGGLVSSLGRHGDSSGHLTHTAAPRLLHSEVRKSPLSMFFLSCSALGECWLGERLSPLLPPSSVCLMLSDWRDGRGDTSVLLLVGLKRQSESV